MRAGVIHLEMSNIILETKIVDIIVLTGVFMGRHVECPLLSWQIICHNRTAG